MPVWSVGRVSFTSAGNFQPYPSGKATSGLQRGLTSRESILLTSSLFRRGENCTAHGREMPHFGAAIAVLQPTLPRRGRERIKKGRGTLPCPVLAGIRLLDGFERQCRKRIDLDAGAHRRLDNQLLDKLALDRRGTVAADGVHQRAEVQHQVLSAEARLAVPHVDGAWTVVSEL